MENLKNYTKRFFNEDDGMELLQVAIVVALSVALIVVVAYLFTMIRNKIASAGDAVRDMETNPNQEDSGIGPTTSTNIQ